MRKQPPENGEARAVLPAQASDSKTHSDKTEGSNNVNSGTTPTPRKGLTKKANALLSDGDMRFVKFIGKCINVQPDLEAQDAAHRMLEVYLNWYSVVEKRGLMKPPVVSGKSLAVGKRCGQDWWDALSDQTRHEVMQMTGPWARKLEREQGAKDLSCAEDQRREVWANGVWLSLSATNRVSWALAFKEHFGEKH